MLSALLLFSSCLVGTALGGNFACSHPPPAPNYSNELYQGRWYEIGKIQTAGGAIFQLGTVCTIATYYPYDLSSGGGEIGYSSRKDTPEGKFVNATGVLEELEAPGHFNEIFYYIGNPTEPVDYNVIWIDEDSAIEYDCNEGGLTTDYCVHIMSRTPTMTDEKLQELLDFADSLDLNHNDLDYKPGDQEGCWD